MTGSKTLDQLTFIDVYNLHKIDLQSGSY